MNRCCIFNKSTKAFLGILVGILMIIQGCHYRGIVPLESEISISISLRSYLSAQQEETTGYGGYSYIIIKNRPLPDNYKRYEAFFRAYSSKLHLDTSYTNRFSVDSSCMNITYWPLTNFLNTRNVTLFEADTNNTRYFIDNYDYVRATHIIGNIEKFPETEGPFIICARTPLASIGAPVSCRDLLVFDLSGITQYADFSKVFNTFQKKVKNNPAFTRGCVFKDNYNMLISFFNIEFPTIDIIKPVDILIPFIKGILP